MQFHYPALLWALGALVLPVLVHLFHLRRAKQVYFSHLPMLRQAAHTSHTHSKLRHRLVLLCRLLALACLVLAFAQPYLPVPQAGVRSGQVLLYIDNSYSMQNLTPSDETALEVALYLAQQIVQSYSQQTQFFLVTNESMSLRPRVQQEVLDKLSTIRYSSYRRTAESLQQRLQSLLQQATEAMDVYWISDFQQNLFAEAALPVDSTHYWHMLLLRTASSANLFIDTVYSESPTWITGEPNKLCLRVQNKRDMACDPCMLKFSVEGTQQALQTLTIDAQHSMEVCFSYTLDTDLSQRVELQVDDPAVRFDDTFRAVLTEAPAVNIVEIAPPEAPIYVEQVYVDNVRFSYRRYAPEMLSYEQLYAQDLVVLHALPQLSATLSSGLRDLLLKGGTLLFIPPERAMVKTYASLLPGFATVDEKPRQQPLAVPDYRLPFYARVFVRNEERVAMPSASPLYTWRPADLQPLLRFVDRRAFLSSTQVGGQRYLLASPLMGEYTDFMRHSLFVPTLYRIAAAAQRRDERPYYLTDMKELRLPAEVTMEETPFFRLRAEQGGLQVLSAQRRGQYYALYLANPVQQPGFYALEQDTAQLMWMAFNLPAAESDLRTLDKVSLVAHFSQLKRLSVVEVESPDRFRASFAQVYAPPVLWGYFLAATLLFLCVEMAYLRYFWRRGAAH